MHLAQSYNNHLLSTLIPPLVYQHHNHQTPFISKNITMHYPHKLKTQSIQSYQLLNTIKHQKQQKRPNFHHHNNTNPNNSNNKTNVMNHKLNNINQFQTQFKKKHCIIKPFKNKINIDTLKLKAQPQQNHTTQQKLPNYYPNLIIKRNGGTAPIRKRLKSQNNKQNHYHNIQQKLLPQAQQIPLQTQLQSVSNIFHYRSKSKLNKLSNLIKFKNKPHILLYSSKLPKDFFGQSLQTQHHYGHQYKFVPVKLQQSGIKKLKYTSSVKLLHQNKNIQKLQQLNFNLDNRKSASKSTSKSNHKNEVQFTFRKQKSKKLIQIAQQQPKNKQNEIPQNLLSTISNQQLNKVNFKTTKLSSQNQHRKLYKNYSRQFLKL